MADKYLHFEQDDVEYNLYDMPKGFVIKRDLILSGLELTELPDLSDVVIEGHFWCDENQLTTLKGAPQKVCGSFLCHNNQLTTLEGAPQKVDGEFDCSFNALTNLRGAPEEVGGDFLCTKNQLTTLKGAPQEIGRGFNCEYNQLTTLEGAPEKISGDFVCGDNLLTTLKGAPKTVGGNFRCWNNKLTSLFGISAMNNHNKIWCDDNLGMKYGFSDSECTCGITFKELNDSTLYKSEVAADNVRRKQQQERKENVTATTKAAFDAWLKNKGIEPPVR